MEAKKAELIEKTCRILKIRYPFVAEILPYETNFTFDAHGFCVKSMNIDGEFAQNIIENIEPCSE